MVAVKNLLDALVIENIANIFTVELHRGEVHTMQSRHSFGLSFSYGGNITYRQGAFSATSDSTHAVLLPEGQDYSFSVHSGGQFPLINFYLCGDRPFTAPVDVPIHNCAQFLRAYEHLREQFIIGGSRAACIGLLYELIGDLVRDNSYFSSIISPGIAYMEQYYAMPDISNQLIAQQCHISEVYFRRLFKQAYQITPKQYIQDLRIRKAKQLLSEGFLSITAVSDACGFSSVYHFSRMFREIVGCTPSAYSAGALRKTI